VKLTNPTFNEEDLKVLIPETKKLWRVLQEKVKIRRHHFYAEEEADPQLFPPYDKGRKFQSDAPRRLHSEAKARLCENHAVIEVNPPHATATQKQDADDLETVLMSMILLGEERQRHSIQAGLSDGQIMDYAGWLHWYKVSDVYPDMDEDYLDELPEDETEAKRYEPNSDYDDRLAYGNRSKRYKETLSSYKTRRNFARARAGSPWYFCNPDPISVVAIPDDSMLNGFAVVMAESQVLLPEYVRKLREESASDEELLSAHDADSGMPMYRILAPFETPSADDYGNKVTVYQIWTRDEFYEVCQGKRGKFTVTKSFKHPYKMPPFAIAAAIETNSVDPARRWEPALEGVYRTKPAYDKRMALLDVISETIATPLFYLARIRGTENQFPDFTEGGDTVYFTRNALASKKVPDGYEIRQLDTNMNPAYVTATEMLGGEYRESFMPTGQAEIDDNTKPWTARLGLQQANVVPKLMLGNQNDAIQTMVRNWTMVMSLPVEEGGTGEVVVYSRDKETGVIDRSKTVSITPEQIGTLDVSSKIEPESASEQLTKQQWFVEMFEKGIIDEYELAEDGLNKPNPGKWIMQKKVRQFFAREVEPALFAQKKAELYGQYVTLGPAGPTGSGFVGPDGQMVEPQQVLQMNGAQPVAPQVPGLAVAPPNGRMPSLPGMATPGTMPMGGLPG